MTASFPLLHNINFLTHFLDKTTAAIKCYECTVIPQRVGNETISRLCSKFEETKNFEVDCPYSTMCKKRVYRLKLQSGDWQETVERSCANQKHDTMVRFDAKFRS